MKDYQCPSLVKLAICILLIPALTACGITLSPIKRKPLEIATFETQLPSHSQKILVRFEDALAGKPLPETVWDNVTGPFWDVEESQQIGYTQNYSKMIPAALAAGAVGGVVGGTAAMVAVGPQLTDTRIVIPFGRLFAGVFQSGLSKNFPNSTVCFDDPCEAQRLKANAPQYVMRVKVTDFQVWENPVNHINLKVIVVSKIRSDDRKDAQEFVFEAKKEVTNQSIWAGIGTSSDFIKQMNRIANKFAESLAADIFGHGMKLE